MVDILSKRKAKLVVKGSCFVVIVCDCLVFFFAVYRCQSILINGRNCFGFVI